MKATNKIIKYLKNLTGIRVSPNSDIRQGVQAEASFSSSRIKVPGLLTSFGKAGSRTQFSNSARTSIFPKTASASASILAPTLTLALAALGISLFSQTAYAASYINVSSGAGGTVSLGSIKPSATGVSASGSDTLTITTNCSAGYSVYVSAQNGGDTNLTNTNSSVTTNNTISASSTAVGSTATTLNSNTWGITGDSASASASKYVGLPSYADATNTALISNSSASTTSDNKSTVYYGVKVDTTLSPGTYSGDVLYTTLVSDKCNNYTVHFDANGGTGSMSDQTIPVGTATPLTANAFSRSGYAFLGWATSANGKTGTASNGIGTEADVDYRDGQSVTDIASFNSTINLYAIWLAVDGDMQSFSTCAGLSVGESKILRDTRDNKPYAIKKLPDGKCWMVQNLRLTNYKLTSADSDVTADFDLTTGVTYSDSSGWCTRYTNTCIDVKAIYYNSSETTSSDKSSYYGALYNWYTATASTGTYSMSSGDAASSICPKGWHLPKGGSSVDINEFSILDKAWGGTGADRINADTYDAFTGAYGTGDNGGFGLAGYINGSVSSIGLDGRYWSPTAIGHSDGYSLGLGKNSTFVYLRNYGNKANGYSVRCIANYDYLVSYGSDGSDSGEPNKTSDGAVLTSDSVTMPTQNTLTKDGYEFKGWALTSSATEVTYTAEQTVSISDLIVAASSAGQTTTPGSTITLYPVWVIVIPDDGNLGTMQDFICNNLTSGHTATLTDSRDNQTYSVYRIPTDQTYTGIGSSAVANIAGKCLMTQDLSLGYITGGSITKGSNLTLTTTDSAAAGTITARTGTSNWNTENADTNLQYINGPSAAGNAYAQHSYYSYGAAQKVCPKGWRLPTSAEYADNSSSGTPTMGLSAIVGNSADGSKALQASLWSFVLGGYLSSSGWYQGSYGNYWSSTQHSSTFGYYLYFNSSNVYRSYDLKNNGRSVRCIADPLQTMQDVTINELPQSVTTTLLDSRDNQQYTVYRWPSSGTAGTDYPTGMAGYAIMTKDLSLGYVTGGSITAGSNLSLTTAASNFDSNTAETTGSSKETVTYSSTETVTYVNSANNGTGWSGTDSYTNKRYTNGPKSGSETYSSHTYYSWGAAMVVCPKGWRLPTNTEYNNIKTFVGGDNSTGSSKIRGTPYNFVYGGGFSSSGWYSVGSNGYYWSSTQYSSTIGRLLFFSSGNLRTDGTNKILGISVRCVAAP